MFAVEMPADPDAIRRGRAESDVVGGEMLNKPMSLEAVLRERTREVVSGTISVEFEVDLAGNVRRRTKVTKLDIKRPDVRSETKTLTEVIERRLILRHDPVASNRMNHLSAFHPPRKSLGLMLDDRFGSRAGQALEYPRCRMEHRRELRLVKLQKSPPRAAQAALICCLALAYPALAAPEPGPSPSCGAPAWPSPALVGLPPNIATDTLTRLPREFVLQPCVGWDLQRYSLFAAAVGSFRASGMDELLIRIGAISAFKGMRYWSVTDGRLEPLVMDASAVEGTGFTRRPDFTPAELQIGRDLYFTERDNRSSGAVLYRMRIVERSPGQVVVDIANANKVGLFLLTLFEPGDLRTALFFADNADGTWTCYALLGIHPTTLAGLLDNHKSHVNRLVALYGHVTGSDGSELPWAK